MSERSALFVSPLDRLVVFRHVLDGTVVGALRDLLATDPTDDVMRTRAYAELASWVFADTERPSLREQVLAALLADENAFTETLRAGKEPSRALKAALESDLRNVQAACEGSVEMLKGEVSEPGLLPSFEMGEYIGFVASYYRDLKVSPAKGLDEAKGEKPVHGGDPRERLVRWLKS